VNIGALKDILNLYVLIMTELNTVVGQKKLKMKLKIAPKYTR